jgi:succinoglycan biosynthesis protein ExoV
MAHYDRLGSIFSCHLVLKNSLRGMQIFQFRGEHPNFGDELNSWMWPKLLPDFFDDDANTAFIGIGSTIGDAPREAKKKIVFGAGFVPHYHEQPNVKAEDWQVYFVRGPRTAQRLGLDPSYAIADAGILVRELVDYTRRTPEHIAFMPHWQSLDRGNWEVACRKAGVTLIDPRRPVEEVLDLLLRSKLVIAEAMHGAIIADAFRVPWVPVAPLNPAHREKWYDWAESLGIALNPQRILPSSLEEFTASVFHFDVNSFNSGLDSSIKLGDASLLSRAKRAIAASPLAPFANACLSSVAAMRLRQLKKNKGSLSSDVAIESAVRGMLEKIEQLKQDYRVALEPDGVLCKERRGKTI